MKLQPAAGYLNLVWNSAEIAYMALDIFVSSVEKLNC